MWFGWQDFDFNLVIQTGSIGAFVWLLRRSIWRSNHLCNSCATTLSNRSVCQGFILIVGILDAMLYAEARNTAWQNRHGTGVTTTFACKSIAIKMCTCYNIESCTCIVCLMHGFIYNKFCRTKTHTSKQLFCSRGRCRVYAAERYTDRLADFGVLADGSLGTLEHWTAAPSGWTPAY